MDIPRRRVVAAAPASTKGRKIRLIFNTAKRPQVGATANHSLFLAIHELAHGLGAENWSKNRLIAMVANCPITIAYAVTFKPYHMAHHAEQGLDGVDTDIPTALEARIISGTAFNYVDHTLRKTLFMFCQIFGYALRPMIVKPDLVLSPRGHLTRRGGAAAATSIVRWGAAARNFGDVRSIAGPAGPVDHHELGRRLDL